MPFTETQLRDLFGVFKAALWPVLAALRLASLAVAVQLALGRARSDVVWTSAALQ